MTDWITDGESGLSVRGKLNSIPNDGSVADVATGAQGALADTAIQPDDPGLLVGFTSSLETNSPNDTVNASLLQASGGTINQDAIISPKGTGALQAQLANGDTSGGNKRGPHAVDLQTERQTQIQVASGDHAVIGGGFANLSSGFVSTVAGGNANVASGDVSFVGGGDSNEATRDYAVVMGGNTNKATSVQDTVGGGSHNVAAGGSSFVGGGHANLALGNTSAIIGGDSCVASGIDSSIGGGSSSVASGIGAIVPGGESNTASGDFSIAVGSYADTRGTYGMLAQAAGGFSFVHGSAQLGRYPLRRNTTDDSSHVLTTDGRNESCYNQVRLPDSASFGLRGKILAREGATGDTSSWKFEGAIKRAVGTAASGTLTLVSNPNDGESFTIDASSVGGVSRTYTFQATLTNVADHILIGADAAATVANAINAINRAGTPGNGYAANTTQNLNVTASAGAGTSLVVTDSFSFGLPGNGIATTTDVTGASWGGATLSGGVTGTTTLVAAITPSLVVQDAGAAAWTVSAAVDSDNGALALTVVGEVGKTIHWIALVETEELVF